MVAGQHSRPVGVWHCTCKWLLSYSRVLPPGVFWVSHAAAEKMTKPYKIPESVLVVVHTADLQVLLVHRADVPDFWQSVTGSKDKAGETFRATAVREVLEETGIDAGAEGCSLVDWNLQNVYSIYPQWRHRYAPEVVHNTEHLFGLQVPAHTAVVLSPHEHTDFVWLPSLEAAERCFSPSNAEAILLLPQFVNAHEHA